MTAELDGLFNRNTAANGLAIIVSHSGDTVPLPGVEADRILAQTTFQALGFAVLSRINSSSLEIDYVVKAVSQLQSDDFLSRCKCIVFVYAGHGGEETIGETINDSLPIWKAIITPLCSVEHSPQLSRIPKLFFFDCCRGGRVDAGLTLQVGRASDREKPSFKVIPSLGNYLIGFSTLRSMIALDSIDRTNVQSAGSIWMKKLMKRLRTSQDTVCNILTEVTRDVIIAMEDQEHIQQTVVISTLREHVHLLSG